MAALYRALARRSTFGSRTTPPPSGERALGDLETAIRLEPPGSPILASDQTNRARLLHREHREDGGPEACDAALAVDPDFLDAHLLRIDVLRKLKRHSEVIRSCDVLLARGKPSAELYELRALAKQDLKDYERRNRGQHAGACHEAAKRGDPGTARQALPPLRRSQLRVARFRRGHRISIRRAPQALEPTSAAVWRVHRSVSFAKPSPTRRAAVRLGTPTDETLYSAARIHAQAAAAAAAEVKKTGQAAAVLATRYQDRALELLRQTIATLPAAERRISCAMSFKLTPRWRPSAIAFGTWIWQAPGFPSGKHSGSS